MPTTPNQFLICSSFRIGNPGHPGDSHLLITKQHQPEKHTLPKTNMDTQNDGLKKVTPFKHGNFWLCMVVLDFRGVPKNNQSPVFAPKTCEDGNPQLFVDFIGALSWLFWIPIGSPKMMKGIGIRWGTPKLEGPQATNLPLAEIRNSPKSRDNWVYP